MLRLCASEDPGRAARARMNRILIVYVTRPQIAERGPRLEYSGSADGASATSPVLTAWLVAEAAAATPARLPHGVARLPHGVARLPHGVVRLPHGVARLPHGVVQA